MKLAQFAGLLPGFDVRTQKIGDTTATSITGPAKAIGYALQLALLVGLLSIDQVTRFGISKNGQKAHLVLTEDPKHQFSKDEEKALPLLNDYSYAHQVTAMDQGVNAAIFDEGFVPDAQTGKAFGQFASAIFDKGKVRGTETNTMILLGRSAQNRVLVTSQWGKKNPLTVVDQEISGDVRYSSCKGDTLLAATYGTSRIAALHVEEIVNMFANGTAPAWKKFLAAGAEIEDIAPSPVDQPTVILTATIGGKRQLVPANVRWGEKDKDGEREFNLTLVADYATDMPESKGPVVRLTSTTVSMVNSNGTDAPRLEIMRIEDFDVNNRKLGASLRRMAEDTKDGTVFAAAA